MEKGKLNYKKLIFTAAIAFSGGFVLAGLYFCWNNKNEDQQTAEDNLFVGSDSEEGSNSSLSIEIEEE